MLPANDKTFRECDPVQARFTPTITSNELRKMDVRRRSEDNLVLLLWINALWILAKNPPVWCFQLVSIQQCRERELLGEISSLEALK